jgi:cytochrome c oxidase subunit 3
MPTIFTPPQVDRPHKADPQRDPGESDHGSGRRPPIDKRTGGNDSGDGDNWSNRPTGSRGPRERLSQSRIGIACALAGDMLFFIAIISAFLVTRSNGSFNAHGVWTYPWHATVIPHILCLNTIVILLSSVAAEFARRSMFREEDAMDEWIGLGRPTSRRAAIWLSITLVLGIVFLAGQWVAWQQLAAQNSYLRANASSHFFYIITITHAVHLFLGLAGLIAALATLRVSRQFATRQVWVDTTIWYWHAMGALWIFLFILLEFFQ